MKNDIRPIIDASTRAQRDVTDEDRRALEVRRRIEDIKEAARLEREALDEVWE